jgi:lipopolysaccharide/colanic/teichoic acid biosynthesis glycosyltransferase
MVVLSPILLVATLAILATDGRPVLFRQARVGRGGRSFTIVKFRTMIRDAEEHYAELAEHSDTRGAAFKMTNDPRITRLGRILRKTSVDELPQLWNVLRGEMSLVGPRPAPAREVVLYEPWHLQRLKMKPGLTGAWQISARMDDDFDRRAAIDVDYVTRWSVLLDVKIILATIPALIRQPGR